MTPTISITGKDAGLVATIDYGGEFEAETVEMMMPEFSGDVMFQRGKRLEVARAFFAEAGDKVWNKISPEDFEESAAAEEPPKQ